MMEGKEDFILTGQLGEVMRESARAALSWIRSQRDVARHRARGLREEHPPHPRPGRGHPQGRPVGRDHDGHGDGERVHRHPRPQGRGDDRRDHAPRPGPADRRPQEQDPRRAPLGRQDGDHPAQEREGPPGHPRGDPQADQDRPGRLGRTRSLEAALRRKPTRSLPSRPTTPKARAGGRGRAEPAGSVDRPSRRRTSRRSSCMPPAPAGRAGSRPTARPAEPGDPRHTRDTGRRGGPDLMDYKDYYKILGVPRDGHARPRSRRPSASSPARSTRTSSRATRPPSAGSRTSTRPTRSSRTPPSAAVRHARRRLGVATPGPAGPVAIRSGPAGRSPASAGRAAGPDRPAATSGTSSARPRRCRRLLRLLPDVLRRRGGRAQPARMPTRAYAGARRRTAGPRRVRRSRTSSARWASTAMAARTAPRRATARPVARATRATRVRRGPRRDHVSKRRSTARTRLVEVDGKRLEVTIPRGVDTGSRIRLGRQRRRWPRPVRRHQGQAAPDLHPQRRRPAPRAPDDARARRSSARRCRSRRSAAGSCSRSRPAPRTGASFRLTGQGMPRLKGEGARRPVRQGPGVLPADLSPQATGRPRTFLDLVDQPDPRATTP